MDKYLITDRIKRELETIRFLFEMQLGKDFNEAQNVFLMPGELATEPRFILNFGFLLTKSDEMFDFATFKSQIRERYETSMDKGGLIKELNEIAEKCRGIISLNDELNNSGIKKLTSSLKEYNAIVEIYNYDISIVYLGLSYSEYWDKDNKAFFPADNCLFLDYVDEVLAFINHLPTEQPKNDKSDKDKKELHNHIFKGNAFEVWQSMFDSFQITESSRTDVKFMFEEMKKDGLIHNTVNQKTFLDWLSGPPYQITIQKTSNYSRTKERISIYSIAKQLYKS